MAVGTPSVFAKPKAMQAFCPQRPLARPPWGGQVDAGPATHHVAILLAAGLAQAQLSAHVEVFATDLHDPPGEIAMPCEPREIEQAEISDQPALANELRMRPLQAHGHLGVGKVYAKVERSEQARVELSAAIDLYRAMELTFWLPHAKAALAQVEGW